MINLSCVSQREINCTLDECATGMLSDTHRHLMSPRSPEDASPLLQFPFNNSPPHAHLHSLTGSPWQSRIISERKLHYFTSGTDINFPVWRVLK